jgi:hypothetical protein
MAETPYQPVSDTEVDGFIHKLASAPTEGLELVTRLAVDALLSGDTETLRLLDGKLEKPARPCVANGWPEARTIRLMVQYGLGQLSE